MGEHEVWPPPIEDGRTGEPPLPPKCSRAATVFGVMSLAVTLPGFLLNGIYNANEYLLHVIDWSAFIHFWNAVYTFLMLLPFVGLVLGIRGWHSLWGKLGFGCAVIHLGVIFAMAYVATVRNRG